MMNTADKLACDCFKLILEREFHALWVGYGTDRHTVIGGGSHGNAIANHVIKHVSRIIGSYLLTISCMQVNSGFDARKNNTPKNGARYRVMRLRWGKEFVDRAL